MAKTYDTYKDSGIAWIGNIPSEWDCCKLLYLLRKPVSDGPHETPILQDSGIPFISVDSLNETEDINFDNVKKFISEDLYQEYSKKTILEEHDILFSKAATIGKTAIVKKEIFMVWSPLAIIKCKESAFYYRFTYHLLSCQKLIEDVIMHGSYNTQINIGMRELEKVNVPFPSLSEQQAIATYLDEKCGEIDSLISLQEEMISELQAYKQSVITEAVTKGLDSNVPMKDSGVEWIGMIPEEWSIDFLSKIIWLRARLGWKGLKAEEYVEEGFPFLSAFNIVNNKLKWEGLNFINKERYDESPEIKLSIGDVLIVKDGAGIGKTARIDQLPKGEATVNSSLGVITPSEKLDYKYLHYFLLSNSFQNIIGFIKNGMGVPHLTQENMKSVLITTPPLSEQQAIASYLDEKTSQIDSLIALKQEKITELKDYKKSIIYEYVTGKKKV